MDMLQEKKIRIGNYDINYLKVGHGPHNILCMSGALGSIWSDFQPQIEGFDREKFTLVAWDPPGYGKSIPPERQFRTDYYAQDVDTAVELMKTLNIKKFSLMGWCYGGVASIILTAKYPELVHKLVVWGARSYIAQHEEAFFKRMKDVSLWPEKVRKPRIEMYGEERFTRLTQVIAESMETLQRTNDGMILSMEVLKKVRCPTLILHGEKDGLIDMSNVYPLHNNIEGSRMFLYPEGKHTLHLKFAEDFNQRVQEFLLED